MAYGLKKTTNKAGTKTTITRPEIRVGHNTSGFGLSKDNPYYVEVGGKITKRFKTKEKAMNYAKAYRKKIVSASRKMLK